MFVAGMARSHDALPGMARSYDALLCLQTSFVAGMAPLRLQTGFVAPMGRSYDALLRLRTWRYYGYHQA